jgi:hypothetical protein
VELESCDHLPRHAACRRRDIILYMDSGSFLLADASPLFDIAEIEGLVFFGDGSWQVGQWSSPNSLMLMDGFPYKNNTMIIAGTLSPAICDFLCVSQNVLHTISFRRLALVEEVTKGCYVPGTMVSNTYTLVATVSRDCAVLCRMTYCQDVRVLNGYPIAGYEHPAQKEFMGHRHDTVALIITVYRWNLQMYRDPSQYGLKWKEMFPNSNSYDQLIREM